MSPEQLKGYESRRSHSGLPTSISRCSFKQVLHAHWARPPGTRIVEPFVGTIQAIDDNLRSS